MPITPELEAMARALHLQSLKHLAKGSGEDASHAGWLLTQPDRLKAWLNEPSPQCVEDARAALLAIKTELTDATVEAGVKANTCALPNGGDLAMAVEPAWEAMIDHILGGEG